jgi:integrase
MAATFTLKDTKKPASQIIICVRFRGALYRRPTGERVSSKYWSRAKNRCNAPREFPEAILINRTLDAMASALMETIAHFKRSLGVPAPADFWKRFESEYYGEPEVAAPGATYLTDYLSEYIGTLGTKVKPSSTKKYCSALSRLRAYEAERGKRILLTDVNIGLYNALRDWLYRQNYSGNYFGAITTVIKTIVRDAAYKGLCDTRGIEHKDFTVFNKDADSIYLTTDELGAIFRLDISLDTVKASSGLSDALADRKVQSLRLVRDRFILGAFTGLRVSDFGRLDNIHIGDRNISIRTVKTDKPVVIPIHPYIREMLARGFDPARRVSDQKMNEHIKEIARMAGITGDVVITENKGGRPVERVCPKCDLVCTHTARRSFATNAYKAGIPSIAIMKITGHTKESTFLKYIKVSAEENADMLASHPFFGGTT